MKKIILFLLLPIFAAAQWKPIQSKNNDGVYYELNKNAITKQISKKLAVFPDSKGNLDKYTLTEFSNFETPNPDYKAYIGKSGNKTVYISTNPNGVSVVSDSLNTILEPVSGNIYKQTKKSTEPKDFECGTPYDAKSIRSATTAQNKWAADDGKLRTSRVAMASPGETTAFYGGVSQTLAAWNEMLTIQNAIYFNDLGIWSVIASGSENLIYTNAATDPFTSISTKAADQQKLFDTRIVTANYDYGLVIYKSTSNRGNAGGIATIGLPLTKGTNVIDAISPRGLTFVVDYICHEVGHQFGATHTHTVSTEGAAQMEPGSGSTIMGYAGITAYNVQAHSDAYFHAISIQQITEFVKSKPLIGRTTITGNTPPTVNAGIDIIVPINTPFELTAIGFDANGDKLTYCWEQFDRGYVASNIPELNTTVSGVLQKSEPPTKDPKRIIENKGKWWALAKKARIMNFRCTVRDGKGATNTDDIKITVKGDPFLITAISPLLKSGIDYNLTWTIGGSTTQFISIGIISNGLERVLIESTPNDGSENITIPNTPGIAQFIIRPIGNVYFAKSNEFTIESQSNAPVLSYTILSGSSIRLNWTQPVGFTQTSFSIYQNPTCDNNDPGGNPCEHYLGTTNGKSFSYTVNNVKSGYTYVVKGKNAAGVRTEKSNTVVVVF